MGLLDALNMGSQALLTQQAAIQVTGNNIANSATPGYARQQVVTGSFGTSHFGAGLIAGGGVKIDQIRRLVDQSVISRMNDAASGMAENQVVYSTLSRVEALMNEMTDTDLSNAITDLLKAFDNLATDPSSEAYRLGVVTSAETLVNRFDYISDGLADIQDTLTEQVSSAVLKADQLAESIANLNVQIVRTESGGGSAASLRDQRDQAVSELSQLIQVDARETEDGSMNIFLGSESLVIGGTSRGLTMSQHEVNSTTGGSELMVSFKDNDGIVPLTSGEITGMQSTRDGVMTEILDRFNALAGEIIWQINDLHASGAPATGYTEMTSSAIVEDPTVPLNSDQAKLAFTPTNGSFYVVVNSEADGATTTEVTQIDVPFTGGAGDMTLDSLVAAINTQVPDVAAEILDSGELRVYSTNPNSSFHFSDDTSGLLATLGLGTFFTGSDATNIGVNQAVADNPQMIAAGKVDAAGAGGEAGDNTTALAIAKLADTRLKSLGGASLLEYHQDLVTDVAVWTVNAQDTASANEVVYNSLSVQRESLSGVNIDEEAVNLMNYQSAFRGAARYISVVNELLDTVINMI